MVKLDLLESIGIDLASIKLEDRNLIKIEKLLLAEIQINSAINMQDVTTLLSFLKSDWLNYKTILLNPNIQNFLFKGEEYEFHTFSDTINDIEKTKAFFAKYFGDNIENAIKTLVRQNKWAQLMNLYHNYPFLFSNLSLETRLDQMLDDVFYNVKRKNVPPNFSEHYSTLNNFYNFLVLFNPNKYIRELDELRDSAKRALKTGLNKVEKGYIKAIKSNSKYYDENPTKYATKILHTILISFVLCIIYYLFQKSTFLLSLQIFLFISFIRTQKRSNYLKEEMIHFDNSISLKKFRFKKTIEYLLIMFFSALFVTFCLWLIYTLFGWLFG